MKIAQIVPSLEIRHGGPSRSVKGLAGGLAQCGQSVELLTTGPIDENESANTPQVHIKAFPRQWPDPLARAKGLPTYLSSARHDIVHSHGLWQRPLHYAHVAAKRQKAPLVISPRGMMTAWAWNHHRWKKFLSAQLVHPGAFEAAAGWHATSDAEAQDIRQLGFKQPICIAPNGVIPPPADDETAEARHWRALRPELSHKRIALFYSRFHSKKRTTELIDLWLSKPRDNWVLLLVGIVEQYSVAQLEAHVIRLNGKGRVIVHDGAGHPPPYAVASLFLLPSHSENFGLVIAEALVRGVPALTTDTTPWQELAINGAGECVSWENYGGTLDRLLDKSPAELHDAGLRARTWATRTFSWDQAAATLVEFYKQLKAQ